MFPTDWWKEHSTELGTRTMSRWVCRPKLDGKTYWWHMSLRHMCLTSRKWKWTLQNSSLWMMSSTWIVCKVILRNYRVESLGEDCDLRGYFCKEMGSHQTVFLLLKEKKRPKRPNLRPQKLNFKPHDTIARYFSRVNLSFKKTLN